MVADELAFPSRCRECSPCGQTFFDHYSIRYRVFNMVCPEIGQNQAAAAGASWIEELDKRSRRRVLDLVSQPAFQGRA
jgi:hypothetical protein